MLVGGGGFKDQKGSQKRKHNIPRHKIITCAQKSCDTVPLIICFNQFLVLLGIFAVYFDSERKIGLHINSKKGHFTSTLLFNLFLGL